MSGKQEMKQKFMLWKIMKFEQRVKVFFCFMEEENQPKG